MAAPTAPGPAQPAGVPPCSLKDPLDNLPPIIATALAGRSIEPARRTSPLPILERAPLGPDPLRTSR